MPLMPLTYRGVEKSSDGHRVAGGVVIDADTPVVMGATGARTARGLPAEPFLGFAERGADMIREDRRAGDDAARAGARNPRRHRAPTVMGAAFRSS